MNKIWIILGSSLIVLAIVLGAFGAHALKDVLDSNQLASFETGVRYQVYHGLSMLILGLNANKFTFSLTWTMRLMLAGVLLFSGSIYFLSLQDMLNVKLSFLGPVTPIGGVLMISSWVLFIVRVAKMGKVDE